MIDYLRHGFARTPNNIKCFAGLLSMVGAACCCIEMLEVLRALWLSN